MQKITPFLWFDDQAEQAAEYYVSIFPDSKIGSVSRYPENSPGPAGTVMTVEFVLGGQQFVALNGGSLFPFTEAVSFVIDCETQAEVDEYWKRLTDGGEEVQCGWLKDKFGLSWQVVPRALNEMLSDPDTEKSNRAMQAMLKMKKLDIDELRRAFDG